jgi:hypothetical protein
MLVQPVVLEWWRRAGRLAFERGEPRAWNPALQTRGLDSPEVRLEKRRVWWRGWDNASYAATMGVPGAGPRTLADRYLVPRRTNFR